MSEDCFATTTVYKCILESNVSEAQNASCNKHSSKSKTEKLIAALQRPKVQSSDLSLTEMLCKHEYLSEPQLCKEEWDKIPP